MFCEFFVKENAETSLLFSDHHPQNIQIIVCQNNYFCNSDIVQSENTINYIYCNIPLSWELHRVFCELGNQTHHSTIDYCHWIMIN